jgi:hypothetical protein
MFSRGAVGATFTFPKGSMMVTFGEQDPRGNPAGPVKTCSGADSNILPDCKQVIGFMEISK